MIVYLSVLIALIGVIMFFVATNPKVAECGRVMFAFGLLAFLLRGEALLRVLQ